MADDNKDPKSSSAQAASRSWWQELLLSIPTGLKWLVGIGLTGAATVALYGDENGQKMIEAILRAGQVVWKLTNEQFRRLELIIFFLANCVFVIDAFLLIQFGSQHLSLGFAEWPNSLINRVVGGMPVILLLQVLLFAPLVRLAKWLIAAAVAQGLISPDGIDDKLATKFVRTVSKLNAWHAVGFALAALPPFHKWPELLAIAAVIVPIWPYFCNAWKEGDSEHLRRITLAVMAWMTLDMAALATLHMIVKAPFLAFYNSQFQFSWIGLAVTAIFLAQAIGAWISGARKTTADQAWEARKVEKIRLETLAQRVAMSKQHSIDPGMLSQLGSVVPGMSVQSRVGASTTNVINRTHYEPARGGLAPVLSSVAFVGVVILLFIYGPRLFTLLVHPQ